MDRLSEKQKAILAFVKDFQERKGYSPSVREIQRGCRISSTSVVDYNLRLLEQKGALRRDREVSRGIDMRDESPSRAKGVVEVPIFGAIAAGDPIPVPNSEAWNTSPEDAVVVPESMVAGKQPVYALRVKGTSMIEDLIDDGDIVLIESRRDAENGWTAAAWLKDEKVTTLKRFYRDGDRIRLQPANISLQPRYVSPEELEVQGRVIGVLRAGL